MTKESFACVVMSSFFSFHWTSRKIVKMQGEKLFFNSSYHKPTLNRHVFEDLSAFLTHFCQFVNHFEKKTFSFIFVVRKGGLNKTIIIMKTGLTLLEVFIQNRSSYVVKS